MGKVGRNMVVEDIHPLMAIKTRSKRMDKTETGKTKQEEKREKKRKGKPKTRKKKIHDRASAVCTTCLLKYQSRGFPTLGQQKARTA